MSEEFYTVEHAAERLKLHPKTVLRLIRESRLRATKVGKSYRILRSDLDGFAGVPPRPAAPAARVTAIVDVPEVDAEAAGRLAALLGGARMGAEAHPEPMSVDIAHDPARRAAKVVMVGAPGDVAAMLRMTEAWLAGRP
ncbi:MAG: helix-turn-helix domain-containing protein [Phenylobacterium sp.]|uniref:helix-turn-helix domain-containing protein n=1 Tax=Phenylobacterium sp. TaxID=1871053 RepID=UPI00391A3677